MATEAQEERSTVSDVRRWLEQSLKDGTMTDAQALARIARYKIEFERVERHARERLLKQLLEAGKEYIIEGSAVIEVRTKMKHLFDHIPEWKRASATLRRVELLAIEKLRQREQGAPIDPSAAKLIPFDPMLVVRTRDKRRFEGRDGREGNNRPTTDT